MASHRNILGFTYFLLVTLRIVDLQSAGKERTIQNPGFVELAKCPCDITQNQCDTNCCCDKECTAQKKSRFESCIPGFLGGQGGAKEAYKCGTNEFNPPDWHKLTCVYWENNAYLGMFFMNKDKITNKDVFSAAAIKYLDDEFSLSEQEARYVDRDIAVTDYRKGVIVTTRRLGLQGDQTHADGLLAVPQHINSGQCNMQAPVRFLEPVQSSCRSQLTTTSCVALSSFSANIYAVSSAITTGTRPFQVTALYKYKDQLIADAEVRYFCATDYSDYLPSTTTSLENLSPTGGSSFTGNLQNANCDKPCSDTTCWQYNTGRAYTSSYDRPLPARCAFDNGQTLPPSPSMTGATCQNVVLEVRYSFEWAGPKIEKLTADVILADVSSVSSTPTVLAQRFSVKWMHSGNKTSSSSFEDNFTNTSDPYQRSGIAGYEPGRPLYSGCLQNDSSGVETVDTLEQKQMAVFKPGVDGLCATARREKLNFGEDVMSACALRLTFDNLKSCDDLRKLVGNHLNVLMPSDVIGRYGYNDPANQDMWISVLRQNLTEAYQSLPITTAQPITANTTGFRLADHVEGICLLPTAVNLLVLYAKTGAINFHPRLEVIGAYVNFTFSNWTMECMGANSQRCSSSSGLTQSFFLHSTVKFMEVPAVPPKPKDRFYTRIDPETCETDTCERYYAFWAEDICYYDTCWQEIAYPLTSEYQGDSHEYALAFFLTLVLGIVGYSSVAKPGWH